MAERVELKPEEMDKVVGGAFNYFEEDGQYYCLIDDVGLFKAKYSAKRQITQLILNNRGASLQEIVDLAIADGEIWQ